MNPRTFVQPVRDGVRNPRNGKTLTPQGDWVELNTYWRRRLADGDVRISQSTGDKK